MEEKKFTISLFSENYTGMLNRITIIFTRRKLNIDSITSSESEVKDIYRYTIVLKCTEDMVIKLVKQLEKQIEILKAFYYEDKDLIYKEIALYKIHASGNQKQIESIAREHDALVLYSGHEFLVIEKTGTQEETDELMQKFHPYGIAEFTRSGRVAVSRPTHF